MRTEKQGPVSELQLNLDDHSGTPAVDWSTDAPRRMLC